MENKLRQILADAIDVAPENLTDKSSPDNTPEWDSFAHLNMVAALEQEFRISLTLDEVIEMQNLPKIKEVVSRKL
ncbi:MAG: acyl carrier protein [Nitrospinae bacterium]|nr:acyl carrier protein [Nitrospinota bacterium]